VDLSGAGMEIAANRFDGVVALESANVVVAGGRIDDTVLATRIFGETGSILVGDGVSDLAPGKAHDAQGVDCRQPAAHLHPHPTASAGGSGPRVVKRGRETAGPSVNRSPGRLVRTPSPARFDERPSGGTVSGGRS
jgi:hypothetical protein